MTSFFRTAASPGAEEGLVVAVFGLADEELRANAPGSSERASFLARSRSAAPGDVHHYFFAAVEDDFFLDWFE